MVLDEVWRRLEGVEALSGPHGGPLRRTVKLVLDPLVIRPVQHPECAGAILTADGATLLATRIHAAADVLRATAAWFTLLKQTRRALRITEGNAQDLYFQRCFELATVSGTPDAVRDRPMAEAALREIHDMTAGRTTQALKEYLADQARARELSELIATAWRRRPVTATADDSVALAELLDACAAARVRSGESGAGIDRHVSAHIGTHSGIRLWLTENTGRAKELGLTQHAMPQPPGVGTSASTASLGPPFDRTIHERVFTVLQVSTERAELPPIPELVAAEIARACAPWSLLDESLRLAAAAGLELAVRLRPVPDAASGSAPLESVHDGVTGSRPAVPLPRTAPVAVAGGTPAGPTSVGAVNLSAYGGAGGLPSSVGMGGLPPSVGAEGLSPSVGAAALPPSGAVPHYPAPDDMAPRPAPGGLPPGMAAARVVNNRWQREAYVLQARRMVLRPDAEGPLAAIAAELRVPWRPYLRRLWARLHGRDVRENPVCAADELWDLLDGVARSVILDHRMRVKRALAIDSAAASEPMESRAG